jgi:hypothetical protein|eukprot:CAMPEP_0174367786 /NCGR_PEP_ID=MMETSP0811_2-20130205/86641_1 /TAXON_ID=73025 ORGANISM="Eutreptiella gymnastica-like, Strain CCMP1594" /NCGR_SAMPLE_ID=MMETSP0811_2 /ASSEMBLY_ACC=CAM_ASM_000667 /LENGTH=196 /DNA_ID=CAMNT_0015510675 /DNA_START=460 /DNA_END=1050 /DNA_ORIENTATION=-
MSLFQRRGWASEAQNCSLTCTSRAGVNAATTRHISPFWAGESVGSVFCQAIGEACTTGGGQTSNTQHQWAGVGEVHDREGDMDNTMCNVHRITETQEWEIGPLQRSTVPRKDALITWGLPGMAWRGWVMVANADQALPATVPAFQRWRAPSELHELSACAASAGKWMPWGQSAAMVSTGTTVPPTKLRDMALCMEY